MQISPGNEFAVVIQMYHDKVKYPLYKKTFDFAQKQLGLLNQKARSDGLVVLKPSSLVARSTEYCPLAFGYL